MKILAADLWPPGSNLTYAEASQLEMQRGRIRLKQLIENVLLYDQVVLPTDNLLCIRFLAEAFGAESIAILIDEEILKFSRFSGQLAYAGGGCGLTSIKLAIEETARENGTVGAGWLPTGIATTAILQGIPGLSSRRARQIAAKVVHATKETDLNAVMPTLAERAHCSVLSPEMDPSLSISNPDLRNLDIQSNQMRILGDLETTDRGDDIQKLMLVARTQLELIAQQQCGCDDLSTLSPVGKVLATRSTKETALDRLYQITNVPDLGAATMRGIVSVNEVVKFRNSRHWQEFAKWFHESCSSEPERVGREYVRLLKTDNAPDLPFFKVVRFLVGTVVSVISPVAGAAVTAADMFLMSKVKEPSPKYFVEELEQLSTSQVCADRQTETKNKH